MTAKSQPSRTLGEVLRPYLLDGQVQNLAEFSAILEVSPRTLQRKLKGNGLTFSALLTQERTRLAMDMLRDRSLSLAEISTALGYSEQSSFTRAFSRTMGIAPGAWQGLYTH